MTEYLVGAGGWAYFNVPGKTPLRAYSEFFDFVEVNCTFYEYPSVRRVEAWRRTVSGDFTFAVRCHRDLTHKIGLKPVTEAYEMLAKMRTYCEILHAPFLVLETPTSFAVDQRAAAEARDLFASVNFGGVRLVWEIRAPITTYAAKLMRDQNIVHATDLSREPPSYTSDVVYSRLFGKRQNNLYQFGDKELVDIDVKLREAMAKGAKAAALSYHGVRMYSDAARFVLYKKTGKFMQATPFTGAASVRAVLNEDAEFPATKTALVADQGWKVVDITADKRVHLSEVLSKIPERSYKNVEEVIQALEATV